MNLELLKFPPGNIGGDIKRRKEDGIGKTEIYYYEINDWITTQKFVRILKKRSISYKEWYDYHHLNRDDDGEYVFPKCKYCGNICRWNNRGKYYDVYCESHVDKFRKDNLLKCSKMKKDTCSLGLFKRKYGEVEGEIRYKEFRNRLGSLSTLSGCIEEYGIEEGTKRYNRRIENIKFSHSLEGRIYKYGKEKGTEIHNRSRYIMSAIRKSKDSCISVKGSDELYYKLNNVSIENLKSISSHSKVSKKLFDSIIDRISHIIDLSDVYYGDNEYFIPNAMKYGDYKNIRFIDFLIKSKKLIIEFQGDYWHPRPKDILSLSSYFDERTENSIINDYTKLRLYRKLGYFVFYVHESEYYSNPDSIIEDCIKFITNETFRDEYTTIIDSVL